MLRAVFGMHAGEIGLVAFIVTAILSARYWPALGERLALLASGHASKPPEGDSPREP